jgi:methylmalonyl-CoA mutase, N-terminal domain
MARVAELGGAVAAIEQGFQKAEIERSAYQIARQIDSGDRKVVGVNAFVTPDAERYEPLRVDPRIEAEQAARLDDLRGRRDGPAVTRALDAVRRAASGRAGGTGGTGEHQNLLPPLRDALSALATVGEVCDALRDVWGLYQPVDVY